MVGTPSNWEDELRGWLKPFLDLLGHKARRRMFPLYLAGLIGPGDRKSVSTHPRVVSLSRKPLPRPRLLQSAARGSTVPRKGILRAGRED